MEDIVYQLVKRLRPDLEKESGQQRIGSVADVVTLLYTLPLGIIGLVWLVRVSDWGLIGKNWLFFILLAVLMYLFNRFSFFIVTEIRSGGYANTEGALDGMVLWSGIFLFGPSALWLDVFWNVVNLVRGVWRARSPAETWNRLRASVSGLATNVLGILLVLPVYRLMGGEFPNTTPLMIAVKSPAALADAGLAGGYSFELTIVNDPQQRRLGEVIQGMAQEAGFNITLRPSEFASALNDDDSAHLLDLIRQLKAQGITFDIAFTSALKRAQLTLDLLLGEMGQTDRDQCSHT